MLKTEIKATDPEKLAQERDLTRLMWFLSQGKEHPTEDVKRLAENDAVFLSILRGSLQKTYSQTMGDVAQKSETVLPWDGLGKLLGEDFLKERTLSLKGGAKCVDERTQTALNFAVRYAKGEFHPDNKF